ncbi:MAG: PhnD/SsuA/transferrin family substrate-binding protein, partial [Campylobacteraceae bacterium]|nr:PhnD/SsuA/transferrin family substrate-binding protein [Campylobacteraceae bacterium]
AVCITFLFALHIEARPLTFSLTAFHDGQKALEEFSPMLRYLEEKLEQNIDFVHEEKYEDIITSFKNNKIDLAYFGPLPLAILQKSVPSTVPILTFNEPDGKSSYQCALVKSVNDKIDFKEMQNIKVALTQPLSTCGFMQTKILLKSYASQTIEEMKFNYMGTHDEVALSIIRGNFIIGGMKHNIAKDYESLGLTVLQTSQMLPSFTLVANANTLTEQEIKMIKKILLEAPPEVYKKWGKSISYGFSEVDLERFKALEIEQFEFTIPHKGNF